MPTLPFAPPLPELPPGPAFPVATGASVAALSIAHHQEDTSLLQRVAAIQDLAGRIQSAHDLNHACEVLATEVRKFLKYERVVVGVVDPSSRRCQISGWDSEDDIQLPEDRLLFAEAVLQECAYRGEPSVWPPASPEAIGGLMAHKQFSEAAALHLLVTCPLTDAMGNIQAVVLLATTQPNKVSDETIAFLQAAAFPIATALSLLGRLSAYRWLRSYEAMRRQIREMPLRYVGMGLVAVLLIAAIPRQYRVKCDCVLEPTVRRHIVSPFDATLETCLVKPGDEVTAGAVLAYLEGRELSLTLEETRADLLRATKERAGHIVTKDFGKAKVSEFEMDRLKSKADLLDFRSDNLTVRSPIDGILVSGDLTKQEGQPLKTGDSMFEVAPLDRLIVEVSVPEADVTYVEAGMPIDISFDAFPFRTIEAKTIRIQPRASVVDEENVFIAEVELENPDNLLRPGMRGRATIYGYRFPLGWTLVRRPLAALVSLMGW